MLRCAQHDKSGKRGCCTWHDKVGMAKLTLWSLSFARRGMFWRKPKQGEVARSSKHFFVIPSIFFCHSKCSFLSFRAPVRNPQHGCFAALSMTGWGQQTSPSGPFPCKRRGTFWRKPKQGEVARSPKHFFVIPSIFFCHSKCSFLSFRARARNPQTILCSNLPNQD